MSDKTISTDAVVIERTFEAPVALIWKMWTRPEHFKAWYGPQGAAVPVAEIDLRVGGKRLVCMEMQTPQGSRKMWTAGEHIEVVPNQRLVYTEGMADQHGNILSPADMGMPEGHPAFTEVTVQLEDLGERTKMVLTHVGIPAGSPGEMGWQQALTKLEAYVATV